MWNWPRKGRLRRLESDTRWSLTRRDLLVGHERGLGTPPIHCLIIVDGKRI